VLTCYGAQQGNVSLHIVIVLARMVYHIHRQAKATVLEQSQLKGRQRTSSASFFGKATRNNVICVDRSQRRQLNISVKVNSLLGCKERVFLTVISQRDGKKTCLPSKDLTETLQNVSSECVPYRDMGQKRTGQYKVHGSQFLSLVPKPSGATGERSTGYQTHPNSKYCLLSPVGSR